MKNSIFAALWVIGLSADLLWSIRKDIPALLRNRYIVPLTSARPKHLAASGKGKHHSGWYRISPAFVAEFKGITTTLRHHAA